MRKLLDFIIFKNLFIGICAGAQTLLTYKLLEIQVNKPLVLVIILCTWLFYRLCAMPLKNMIINWDPTSMIREMKYKNDYKLILILSVAILIFLAFLKWKIVVLLFLLAGICILYNYPLFRQNTNLRSLRDIDGLKAVIIVFIWVFSTICLPFLDYRGQIDNKLTLLVITLQVFFMSALVIAYDLRDIKIDGNKALKTIPVMLGERRTKIFCYILLACVLLLAYGQQETKTTKIFVPYLFSVACTAILIFKANQKRSNYFFLFWLDGMCLFQYAIFLAFSRI